MIWFTADTHFWHRLAFRLDFEDQALDVFLDGRIIAAGLPFETSTMAFDWALAEKAPTPVRKTSPNRRMLRMSDVFK